MISMVVAIAAPLAARPSSLTAATAAESTQVLPLVAMICQRVAAGWSSRKKASRKRVSGAQRCSREPDGVRWGTGVELEGGQQRQRQYKKTTKKTTTTTAMNNDENDSGAHVQMVGAVVWALEALAVLEALHHVRHPERTPRRPAQRAHLPHQHPEPKDVRLV